MAKEKVSSMLPEAKPAPVLNEKSIADSYNRAIKPTVTGKVNASQVAQANSRVVSGVKAIADNKDALQFTDEAGNVIKGQTPKSVSQLSDAIGQTKETIYQKYNALATQAGEKGISVNTRNIGMELDPVIQSKSLAISNPSAVKYAQELQTRLWKNGELDAKTAQEVIQNYNAELKSFYRNPTYGLSSNVQIDALVANNIRKALDDGITNATGEQYQALKNQYGALASMEKDVARKAQQIAKQNNVPFANNLSNLVSGAELVRGLVTLNPADIAVSAGVKGIQKYIQYLNNPDVGVSKIFSEIEKSSPSSKGSMSEQGGLNIKSDSSPKPTTFTPKSQIGKGISSAVKKVQETPNKQGGYVKLPTGQTIKSIDAPTKQEIYTATKYLDSKVITREGERNLNALLDKYKISPDLSVSKIKARLTALMDKTKTS